MKINNCGSNKYKMLTYFAKTIRIKVYRQCPMKTKGMNVHSATICGIALELEHMSLERVIRGQRHLNLTLDAKLNKEI